MIRGLGVVCLVCATVFLSSVVCEAQDDNGIKILSSYLENLEHAQGRFLQVSPKGERLEGKFYLSRPGLMRFEYDPPHHGVVVADGVWVLAQDKQGVIDRYPLSRTPLGVLLSPEGALKDVRAKILSQTQDTLVIQVGHKKLAGTVFLEFSVSPLALQSWRVLGPQGQETWVKLLDVVEGEPPCTKSLPPRRNRSF